MSEQAIKLPDALRARLAADYAPVKPLPAPMTRALWMLPFAALALLAAQFIFELRVDAPRLGWGGTWGMSIAQVMVGLVVVAAALREAVPGRAWSGTATRLWIGLPIVMVVAVTLFSWGASPVRLRGGWYFVGALCLTGSIVSALPAVLLASILAARAYPTRPAVAGALLGLGAGLMADAGWRLFCHFSEPSHVLSAHLGGVIVSMCLGAAIARRLAPNP
ncbi:MAG: NrsF family protein [Vicinamibacterales bacterium]